MPERTDEQLVILAVNGDTGSFEELVIRYEKQVFALAFRLCGDYAEAQDLAQEAFLRIYRELPRFDTERRFFPWMYRVAQNACINVLKKRPRELTPLDELPDSIDITSLEADPETHSVRRETNEAVTEAINALPEAYRLPIALKYLAGLSYQEISEQLELPISTIETRLFRGRQMLKKSLADFIK